MQRRGGAGRVDDNVQLIDRKKKVVLSCIGRITERYCVRHQLLHARYSQSITGFFIGLCKLCFKLVPIFLRERERGRSGRVGTELTEAGGGGGTSTGTTTGH